MPKIIDDPTPDTMNSLVYNRITEKDRTLVGTYNNIGVFTGVIDSMDFIDASVDQLYALVFTIPPGPQATMHVEVDLAGKRLLLSFQDDERSGSEVISGVHFDKQFADAIREIFAQAFKAGMLGALGF